MSDRQVDVAIVGGGPVGLTAALLLGRLGISCIVFERNETTSFHPRGHVVNARSMEIFRQAGVEDAVNAASLPLERHAGIGFVISLAGEEIGRLRTRGDETLDALERSWSPVLKRSCPQDVLEPILKQHAEACHASSLRFGVEITGLQDVEDAVLLSWRAVDGGEGSCRARYVIGADGARSFVREVAGIPMTGRSMGQQIGVYFHADLYRLIEDRPFLLWWIYNARTTGVLISLDGRYRWTYNFPYQDDESRHDFTEARCLERVRAAIGDPDIDVRIDSIVPWRMQARMAESLRSGRLFLAGDAAHPLPPTGGQGMNTGIGDVHNLAWKLNLVLKGLAPDSLLDSYQEERLPVARFNVQQSARNAEKMAAAGLSGILALDRTVTSSIEGPQGAEVKARLAAAIPAQRGHFDYPGQTFGYAYSSSILAESGAAESDRAVETYTPSGAPGHRAPHFWIVKQGVRISSIDLFSPDAFTLLTGRGGGAWADAFRHAVETIGVSGRAFVLDAAEDLRAADSGWLALYGMTERGAVLVRPDGHVAWRCVADAENPQAEMVQALERSCGRRVETQDRRTAHQDMSA